ncbi:hypothetical protein K8I28_10565 [bacterium]|nr:hypothetical protein [bacterium]
MQNSVLILIVEAMIVYLLVLSSHALRHRFGLALFYSLMGGITAIMSWVTDAGVQVEVFGITFMIGSTVFYTSLLLGVFVVYVFDGPRATRVAIFTIIGVSVLVPLIATALHFQMRISMHNPLSYVPVPSLRVNTASVIATFLDLVFLAIAWEYLGKPQFRMKLLLRSFFTLLGVMWLDVVLFSTGAFLGTPHYLGILQGTLYSRLIISIFASPFLWGYLYWQNSKKDVLIEARPVLAILQQVADIKLELSLAQQEIERRKEAELKLSNAIKELKVANSEVKTLQGFLPICANCKKIRNDQGYWQQLEQYISANSGATFSHGICPDCIESYYAEIRKHKKDISNPST